MTRLRCAVYTRKSSEEGLEQDFNSLDAQREACAAFVRSQQHEGWSLIETRYDGGGFSGGTLERPALTRLLQDLDQGRLDTVVVYKVDRLTRSLSDFARIIERFDARAVSFVSVTQQFNTTSSMGRLTLNVLLSFAQFEREVTAERIRDKIAASKARGMWMGGRPPLGYDVHERKLVVNEAEAAQVRHIYTRYLELGNVRLLRATLAREGITSKRRTGQTRPPGTPGRGALYRLLSNPTYRGLVAHKGRTYNGQHDAIVDETTWAAVQQTLADNRAADSNRTRVAEPARLAGRIVDQHGNPLGTNHACRHGKRYRYYVARTPAAAALPSRLPAHDLEQAVLTAIERHRQTAPETYRSAAAADKIAQRSDSERWAAVLPHLERVVLRPGELEIMLSAPAAGNHRVQSTEIQQSEVLCQPFTLTRRGGALSLITPDDQLPRPSNGMLRAVARTWRWNERLMEETGLTLTALAREEGVTDALIRQHLPLRALSPTVLEALLAGRALTVSTVDTLVAAASLDWAEQEARLLPQQPISQR